MEKFYYYFDSEDPYTVDILEAKKLVVRMNDALSGLESEYLEDFGDWEYGADLISLRESPVIRFRTEGMMLHRLHMDFFYLMGNPNEAEVGMRFGKSLEKYLKSKDVNYRVSGILRKRFEIFGGRMENGFEEG